MKISFLRKIKLIFLVYTCLPLLPDKFFYFFNTLLSPVESTRYTEFIYLLNFIKRVGISADDKILDVSSPYILSYLLSKRATIIKTDINPAEACNIKPNQNLIWKIEDATKLSFPDNEFNLVYSISVIEHIYNQYSAAIKEMVRVCKKGGYIYISFPVSKQYVEEWLEHDIYSHQYKTDVKTFFQYRFDEKYLRELLSSLSGIEVAAMDIYWERKDFSYRRMTRLMRKKINNRVLYYLSRSLLNFFYGFFLLTNKPADFSQAKDFGNVSLILKKN